MGNKKLLFIPILLTIVGVMLLMFNYTSLGTFSSFEDKSNKNDEELKVVSFHGNYVEIDSPETFYEESDIVIIAEPIEDFLNRNHVLTYSDDGSIEDYFTETKVKIKKVLKSPSKHEIDLENEYKIIEPAVSVYENHKDEKVKLVTDSYMELEKGTDYLIFLKENIYGEYAVFLNMLGKYSLADKTIHQDSRRESSRN